MYNQGPSIAGGLFFGIACDPRQEMKTMLDKERQHVWLMINE